MWHILVSSICLASFKFAVAEDLRYGQQIVGQLKYWPSLRAPLFNSPPSSNVQAKNQEEKNFESQLRLNKINSPFEESITSSANCPQLESLGNILDLLKGLLNQNEASYVLRPDERIQILDSIKEYLEKSGSRVSAMDDHSKVKEISRTGTAVLVENVNQSLNHKNRENNIEANFVLKYDIPNRNGDCKETLAKLIQMVKDLHLQMINYCNQSGKCNLNSQADSSNTQHNNIFTLNNPMSSQSKPSSQQSLSIHDVQNSIYDLDKSKNQAQTHVGANIILNPETQPQSVLQPNQFEVSNMLNAGVVQTLNNVKKHKDVYNNIYLKNEATQSNIQHGDKSNVLDSIYSIQNPIPSQLQITPANHYPYNVQNSLDSLMIPQQQEDLSNMGPNRVLELQIHPDSYLYNNQFLTNGMNRGVQTKNVIKQEENQETPNNNFDSNDIKQMVYTPMSGLNQFEGINKLLPLFQAQHADYPSAALPSYYIDNPYQQMAYKQSQIFNDKSASVGMVNQFKYNVNQNKYEEATNPGLVYSNLNGVTNFASENVIPSKVETNVGQFQNDYKKLLVNPTLHSNLNMKQSPYLSSINVNRLNGYSSQQADAEIQSNLGLNLYAPANLMDYPKHDIYGNTLFDSQRLASMPNLVKLNSVADNEGVVELTYKLKKPQSISYSPYYYVKLRMLYKDFVSKIKDLSKNPDLRTNPTKVYEELLSVSNLTETSPDLFNIERDQVSKLILNNGGTLINAKVLGLNDSDADKNLNTIQNLNANLNTNDILNVVKNDKIYNPFWSSKSPVSSIPIVRQEQNLYDGEASNLNVNPQYIPHLEPRRLSLPSRHVHTNNMYPISFLPAKFNSQIPSNVVNYPMIYSQLN